MMRTGIDRAGSARFDGRKKRKGAPLVTEPNKKMAELQGSTRAGEQQQCLTLACAMSHW